MKHMEWLGKNALPKKRRKKKLTQSADEIKMMKV